MSHFGQNSRKNRHTFGACEPSSEIRDNLDQRVLREAPIPSLVLAEIANLEAEQLKSRQNDYDREKAFFQNAVKQTDKQSKSYQSSCRRGTGGGRPIRKICSA